MISDKNPARRLYPKQQRYVIDNHRRMYISEMARNLSVSKMSVMDFMDEKDLPAKIPKGPKAVPKEKPSNKFFRHDKAWI